MKQRQLKLLQRVRQVEGRHGTRPALLLGQGSDPVVGVGGRPSHPSVRDQGG